MTTDRAEYLSPARANLEENINRYETLLKSKENRDTYQYLQRLKTSIDIQALTWGSSDLHRFHQYDVILGADLLYIEDTFTDLIDTLLHLSNFNTVILMAAKIRYHRAEKFIKMATAVFDIEVIHKKGNLRIYKMRKMNDEL